MSRVKALLLGACLAAASAAVAQPLHVNDIHYIVAARCQGLITSDELGPAPNPTGINRFMDIESGGRTSLALDQANDARERAKREAATADPDRRAQLVAERDGPCRFYAGMGFRAPAERLEGH